MTEIIESMPNLNGMDQQQFTQALVAQARSEGVELIGPGGLLTRLTKSVLETALEAELSEHLGYEQYDAAGRNAGNSRNGTRTKTVFTEIGPVEIEVPRDRDGTFEPAIVKKRQRRLTGVDQIILSLSGPQGSRLGRSRRISPTSTPRRSPRTPSPASPTRCCQELADWRGRPLDRIYSVIFIDAIVVKVCDGQVTNRPVYVTIGVSCNGERDILGLWAGDGGEGAKFWLGVLTEIKNRGVEDFCIVVCDGLKVLPDSITTCWPLATAAACVIHLLRNTFRFASRKYWDAMAKDLRPIYTAANEAAAVARFQEFDEQWGQRYPAITRMWRSAWVRAVPGLRRGGQTGHLHDQRESLNARYRRAIRARGHCPTEQAALKCLYLATRSLDPTGRGRARWVMRWKPGLNAFAVTFEGRIDATTTN